MAKSYYCRYCLVNDNRRITPKWITDSIIQCKACGITNTVDYNAESTLDLDIECLCSDTRFDNKSCPYHYPVQNLTATSRSKTKDYRHGNFIEAVHPLNELRDNLTKKLPAGLDPIEDECQSYLASLKHAYGTPKFGLKWEDK